MSSNKLVRSAPFYIADNRSTANPNNVRASINLTDTDRGAVLNRLSTEQRNALDDVVEGMVLYNTTTKLLETWNGSEWISGGNSDSNEDVGTNSIESALVEFVNSEELNSITDGSIDDSYIAVSIPFPIVWGKITYEDEIYVGTNSYITFGGAVTGYNNNGTQPSDLNDLPAIVISSADNSLQRLSTRTVTSGNNTIFTVHYEGTDSTSGISGDPKILWEVTFYSNIPNVADLIVGINERATDEEYPGTCGIADQGRWIINQSGTPWVEGTTLRLTYENNDFFNIPESRTVDFQKFLEDTYGIEDLVGYWRFNEKIGRQYADSSSHGLEAYSITGVSANAPNPINDGYSAVQLHGGNIYIPFSPTLYPNEEDGFTVFFTTSFTDRNDFIEIEGTGDNGPVWKIEIYGDIGRFVLYDENGNNWSEIEVNVFGNAMKAVVAMTVDHYGEIDVYVNDLHFNARPIRSDGRRPTPQNGLYDKDVDDIIGILISGGIDSPCLSHLGILPYRISTNDAKELINNTGLNAKTIELPETKALANSDMSFAYGESFNLSQYWDMNDKFHTLYLYGSNNSRALRIANGTVDIMHQSPILDGKTAVRLYNGTTIQNLGYDVDFFQTINFALAVVYKPLNTVDLTLSIAHNDGSYLWQRVTVAITDTQTTATMYADDGISTYLEAELPVSIGAGGKVFVMAYYYAPNDTLYLHVNEHVAQETGGSGAFLGLLETPNPEASSFSISGEGIVSHVGFGSIVNGVPNVGKILSETGFVNPVYGPTATQQITVGDYQLTIVNGLITNITEVP